MAKSALNKRDKFDLLGEKLTMIEIVFLVEDNPEGGYTGRAFVESIFTQADDIETMRDMVRDTVHCHFPDQQNRPKVIRLQNL